MALATTASEEIVVDEGVVPSCAKCEKSLIGYRYVLKEEKPYCIPCYEEVFANPCFSCKSKIGCESKVSRLVLIPCANKLRKLLSPREIYFICSELLR